MKRSSIIHAPLIPPKSYSPPIPYSKCHIVAKFYPCELDIHMNFELVPHFGFFTFIDKFKVIRENDPKGQLYLSKLTVKPI